MIKDKNVMLMMGIGTLLAAIILNRLDLTFSMNDFIQGMLYGMSATFNIFYLLTLRRKIIQ